MSHMTNLDDFTLSIDSNGCQGISKLLVELLLSVDGNEFHKLVF